MPRELEEIGFRTLFDVTADAMLIVDGSGHIVLSNLPARKLLGYSEEALWGLPVEAIMPARYREHHRLHRMNFDQKKRSMGRGLELFALTRDGMELPVNIGLCPFVTNGEHHCLVTLHVNETAIRFLQLAENIHEVFWLTTPDKQEILYISPGYEKIWGRSCASLHAEPTSWIDAVVPEDRETVGNAAMNRQITGNYDIEYRIRRPDGETRWIRDRAFPVADGWGKIYRIAGIAEDITERKRNESALHCQSFVLGSMDQGVSYTDDRGVMRFTNAAFDAMFDYDQGELTGKHVSVLNDLPPAENERFIEEIFSSLEKNGIWEGDLFNLRKDGTAFESHAVVKQLRMGDETIHVAIQEDVTERKRVERDFLERKRKLDELHNMQLANHTASAIAHELNQPLFSIAAYNQAAIRLLRSGNFDAEKLVHVLEACERQAQRAGHAIRMMLNLLNNGASTVETFDINQEILNALSIVKSDNNMNFKTSLHLADGLPPVQANRIRVQKVLVNLLNNGVEAMEAAGVRAPTITVLVHTLKASAQVSIKDNGPGLSKENTGRIFEPFYTTKTKGIGVGLAISRSLIEDQGGTLWADAGEGNGATFHFTVPFAK